MPDKPVSFEYFLCLLYIPLPLIFFSVCSSLPGSKKEIGQVDLHKYSTASLTHEEILKFKIYLDIGYVYKYTALQNHHLNFMHCGTFVRNSISRDKKKTNKKKEKKIVPWTISLEAVNDESVSSSRGPTFQFLSLRDYTAKYTNCKNEYTYPKDLLYMLDWLS